MPADQAPPSPRDPAPRDLLERELAGDLPCVVCKYNLRGLSIRANCPECGAAVRATILAAVDPHADAFVPLRRPQALSTCLLLWSGGACVAAVCLWIDQVIQIADLDPKWHSLIAPGVLTGVIASALGSVGFAWPLPGRNLRRTVAAALGAAGYVPLAWMLYELKSNFDRAAALDYLNDPTPDPNRIVLRLLIGLTIASIILLLRPAARALVARSLVLRTGRVDRQTMYAIAAAAIVAMLGDCLLLLGAGEPASLDKTSHMAGVVLVAFGSVLLTLGVFGAFVDSVRIARAVLTPAPGLRDLMDAGGPSA